MFALIIIFYSFDDMDERKHAKNVAASGTAVVYMVKTPAARNLRGLCSNLSADDIFRVFSYMFRIVKKFLKWNLIIEAIIPRPKFPIEGMLGIRNLIAKEGTQI